MFYYLRVILELLITLDTVDMQEVASTPIVKLFFVTMLIL
jgi:hypothetical protein